MLLVQMSDPHFLPRGMLAYGKLDVAAYLERAVAHVAGLEPAPDARHAALPRPRRTWYTTRAPVRLPVNSKGQARGKPVSNPCEKGGRPRVARRSLVDSDQTPVIIGRRKRSWRR